MAAVAAATEEAPDASAVIEAAGVSEGSVGRALALMGITPAMLSTEAGHA